MKCDADQEVHKNKRQFLFDNRKKQHKLVEIRHYSEWTQPITCISLNFL